MNVIERHGRHQLKTAGNGKLQLMVNPGTSTANKLRVLNDFYRDELKSRISTLLEKWQPRVGVSATFCGVKKMKTKWGSCNTATRRIWLNLELAKKPPECLEYILLHELVHLLQRHHNELFRSNMDSLMPDWRERRDLLNSSPLANERWGY